ncbi:MAG: phosphatase PAP2 family protein [Bacteroidota bacterium]
MYKRILLFIMTGLAGCLSISAQDTDTGKAGIIIRDSSRITTLDRHTGRSKTPIAYKSFLIPATLIVYGILAGHTDAFQDINEAIKEEVFTERRPAKTKIDNYLQYAPAVLVYGLNIAGIHGKNNFRDRTIIYGISNLIVGATVYATKNITAETRPDGSDNLSFPSGHTATSFAAAEFLRQEYKDVSPWYGVGGYLAAAATGYLRISNNKHWAGDVVAGAGVGIASARLAYLIYPAIKRKLFKNREVSTLLLPGWQNGSWGLALVHHF